jgi:hypothetical protein
MICPELLKSLQSKYYGAQDNHLSDKTIKSNYDDFHSTFSETDLDEWYKVMKSDKYQKIPCEKKVKEAYTSLVPTLSGSAVPCATTRLEPTTSVIDPASSPKPTCLRQPDFGSNRVNDTQIYEFALLRQCDFIEDLNIVIKKQKGLEYQFGEITLEISGLRVQRLYDTTQLNVLNSVYGQHTVEDEDTITIPCTFTNRIIPLVKLLHHEVRIKIEIIHKTLPEPIENQGTGSHKEWERQLDVDLYGNMYYLNLQLRRQLFQSQDFFNTTTRIIQSQFTGEDNIKRGINHIRLPFNHPVFLIYFYGIDQAKINNIQFVVNGETVYDRSIFLRDRSAQGTDSIGLLEEHDNDKTFIYFSKTFDFDNLYNNETINFSRIEKVVLVIDTDQEDDATLNIVGLNYGIARTGGGMYGLAFSK